MPPENTQDPDPYLELDETAPEDLGEEVQKTNSELEKLRQQLETIEKQKLRLEELKRRQEELETGKAEMLDKLTRSLGTVQRETEDAQKRLEQLHTIQNSFTQHLRYIDSINPKLWGANELPRELSKAISAIEDARADYAKAQAKIAATAPAETEPAASSYEDYAGPEPRDFGYWFKSGFAFTLPLQLFALLALLTWIWSVLSATPVR